MPRVDRINRFLLKLAFAVFACRALVPVGYMPAIPGGHGVVTLCHGDPAARIVMALTAPAAAQHAHHAVDHDHAAPHPADDEPQSGAHDAWEHCPIGAAFSSAALVSEFSLQTLDVSFAAPTFDAAGPIDRLFRRQYAARAPPLA